MEKWKYKIIHEYNGHNLIKEYRKDEIELKYSKGAFHDDIDFIIYAEKDDFKISLGRVLLIRLSDVMIRYYFNYNGPIPLEKYWAKYVYNQQKNKPTFQFSEKELISAFKKAIYMQTGQGLLSITPLAKQNFYDNISKRVSVFFHKDLKFKEEQWNPTLNSERYILKHPFKVFRYIANTSNNIIEELEDFKEKLQWFTIKDKDGLLSKIIKAIDAIIKTIKSFLISINKLKEDIGVILAFICGLWNGFIEFIAGIVDIILLAFKLLISSDASGHNLEYLELKEGIEEVLNLILADPAKFFNTIINLAQNYVIKRHYNPDVNIYHKSTLRRRRYYFSY